MAQTGAPTFRRTLQVLVAALMAAPLFLAIVGIAVLTDGLAEPPAWTVAAVAGHGALTAVLLQAIGVRTVPAIVPGTPSEEAQRTSAGALQSALILRFALSEAVALVALALAFSVESGGLVVLLFGVVLSEALMAVYVWPGDRVVNGVQAALERDGGVSQLRAALDGPPPTPGA